MSFHRSVSLVVVHEQKSRSRFRVHPCRHAQGVQILRGFGLFLGKKGFGSRQAFSEILKQKMDFFQLSEASVDLAGFPDAGLEVIALYRKVVVVAGGPGFLKGAVFSVRIDAAVIHVIAQQIGSASQHADGLGLNIFRRRPGPSVRGHLKASSQLRRQIGADGGIEGEACAVLPFQIRADVFILLIGGKYEIGAGGHLFHMLRPGSVHIAAQNGKGFPVHHIGAAPARRRIIGYVKARFQRQLFQGAHVRHPLFPVGGAAAVAVFIFQLDAEDGASILTHHSCRLFSHLLIKGLHQLQIGGIIGSHLHGFILCQPVREASVSALSMRPGPDAQPHRHIRSFTGFQKASQVPASGEIPLSLPFLMVNPEHVGGDDAHASGLHFQKFLFPVLRLISGKMKFSHHRKEALSVFQEAQVVHLPEISLAVRSAHGEKLCLLPGAVNDNSVLVHFPLLKKQSIYVKFFSATGSIRAFSFPRNAPAGEVRSQGILMGL